MKKTRIQYNEYASEAYRELCSAIANNKKRQNPTYQQILSSLTIARYNIESDHFYGDLIPKRNITKQIIDRYKTTKIFRVELVGYWRLLYTIMGHESSIVVLILDFMDHDRYNKLFGYKKR